MIVTPKKPFSTLQEKENSRELWLKNGTADSGKPKAA